MLCKMPTEIKLCMCTESYCFHISSVCLCVCLAMPNQFDYAGEKNEDSSSIADIDIKPLVEPLAIALIVIGIILLIVSFLGLLGACCDNRIILAVVSLRFNYTVS